MNIYEFIHKNVKPCKANKLMYAVKNASSMNDFSHLNKFLSIQI